MQKNIENRYIKELKQGSRMAFNALYDMYSPRLYRYCYQYTKSREDTEEIVQDIFMKLWTYRETIRDEETILHFLFRVAKNQLINIFRSRVNDPTFEEYVEYCNGPALSVCDTSHAVEYDDFCKLLDNIKRSLPETQQRVYEYSKIRQQSNKEIAEALNLSEQTVKNQLSLAIKHFKEKLKNYNLIYLLIGLLNS